TFWGRRRRDKEGVIPSAARDLSKAPKPKIPRFARDDTFRVVCTPITMTDTTLPKISVVVTCFNCADYIGAALRSVARQTWRDFECVIVDDASTDASVAAIQATLDELKDQRFSLVRLEKNVGQTGATRVGLKHTNAPF